MAASFNPVPSSIQITRMLRRAPALGGIGFKSGVTQKPFALKRADGGAVPPIPDHPMSPVIGAINTDTPGRADEHPTHVPSGSYVVSAENVAHIGGGNSANGLAMLAKMFLPAVVQGNNQIAMMGESAPYGATGSPFGSKVPQLPTKSKLPPRIALRPPTQPTPNPLQALGGAVPHEGGQPGTPINISGGEFVIPPDEVKRRGRGDMNRGHEILDAWMKQLHEEHIKTLKKLPGPAR